jgi:enoyl-CoA hydratase/carnithine racemase
VNAQDALNLGLVDAIHKTTDEKKQSYEEIINEFLKPYLDQPYPKSVRSMKNIVSATEPASNVASEAAAYTEFHNRWCSEDNIKAINLNKATHHHKTQ